MTTATYRLRTALLAGAASLAALTMFAPGQQARADDCLMDRDNDGVVDAATDNDASANSSNDDTSLACGTNALATGAYATDRPPLSGPC
jgi:hypothetical protein